MRTTLINLHKDLSTSFIHHHLLMNKLTKNKAFPLCLVLVPNDISTKRSGRRNFIPPFVRDGFLEGILGNNPLPSKLGQVGQERRDLMSSNLLRSKKS